MAQSSQYNFTAWPDSRMNNLNNLMLDLYQSQEPKKNRIPNLGEAIFGGDIWDMEGEKRKKRF